MDDAKNNSESKVENNTTKKQKKKIKKPLLIAAIIVLLAAAGCGTYYYINYYNKPIPVTAQSQGTPQGEEKGNATNTTMLQGTDQSSEVSSSPLAEKYFNLGMSKKDSKEYKDAVSYFNKAIEADPKLAKAYFELANSLFELYKYNDSIENYKQAILLSPNNSVYRNNYGNALASRYGHSEEALEQFYKAVELDPNNDMAYNNIGNIMREKEDYNKALEYLDKAIQINPNNLSAFENKASVYRAMKNFPEAIKCFDEVLKINPEYVDGYISKAQTYNQMNQYDDEIATYDELNKLNSYKYADMYGVSGYDLYNQDKYEDALKFFMRATEIYEAGFIVDPENYGEYYFGDEGYSYLTIADIYYYMANSYLNLNNMEEFYQHLKKSVELDEVNIGSALRNKGFNNVKATKEFENALGEVNITNYKFDELLESDMTKLPYIKEFSFIKATTSGDSATDTVIIDSLGKYLSDYYKGNVFDEASADSSNLYKGAPNRQEIISYGKLFKESAAKGSVSNVELSDSKTVIIGKLKDETKSAVIKLYEKVESPVKSFEGLKYYIMIKDGETWQYYGEL